MPWPVHPTGFFGTGDGFDTYRIENSLRFNSADSAYLNRTPASAGNRKTWTWSGWVKQVDSSGIIIFGAGTLASGAGASDNRILLTFDSGGTFSVLNSVSGTQTYLRTTNALYRDYSAWMHVVVAFDTTQATANDRLKIYVNGSEITSFSTINNLAQNTDGYVNNTIPHHIVRNYGNPSTTQNCYLTEIYLIDGQALNPSKFGRIDSITGRWKAAAYSGTYGTNGFYLKFADNSGTTATTLGKDSSSNGNNWTPNNFSVDNTTGDGVGNDSLVDSPTNYGLDTGLGGEVRGNYCTFNPLKRGSTYGNLSNGNLTIAGTTGAAGQQTVQANIAMSSGKWYAEAIITTVGAESAAGIAKATEDTGLFVGSKAGSYGYYINGLKYNNNSGTSYGSSYTTGDVIGVAFDADLGNLVFYKNGTSQGTAFTGLTSGPYVFEGQGRSATSANNNSWNFGQRPWKYTAPSGFKALCTQNLPQPTIQKPSKYMDALAYTGTGASNSISSLGFSPDLVWIKNRGTTTDHALYDIVRGAQQQLSSNSTAAEVTSSTGLTAFDSAGFTIGTSSLVNTSGTQYVAWSWDAGSTNSTNTSGSITSTVRANPQAGVSIVSFVNASGTNQSTVGHGLGSSPKMIIAKNRDTGANNWAVFHSSVCDTTSKFLQLNTTAALTTFATVWGASLPSSSVFGVTGGGIATASVNMIAYCFAEIEGYSKFGSYTGNGSADGPFVWCGFRPRWVMIKVTTNASENWYILDTARDTANATGLYLFPSANTAETNYISTYPLDIVSSGFKLRNATYPNTSSATYIFAAFAESPFKYARAR
jgi:hypothetical protein